MTRGFAPGCLFTVSTGDFNVEGSLGVDALGTLLLAQNYSGPWASTRCISSHEEFRTLGQNEGYCKHGYMCHLQPYILPFSYCMNIHQQLDMQ